MATEVQGVCLISSHILQIYNNLFSKGLIIIIISLWVGKYPVLVGDLWPHQCPPLTESRQLLQLRAVPTHQEAGGRKLGAVTSTGVALFQFYFLAFY